MSLFPVALLIAFGAFWASTHHLHTSLLAFYDFVALAMVVGGTLAVALCVLPWNERREIFRAIRSLFLGVPELKRETLQESLRFILARQNNAVWTPNSGSASLPKSLLQEGWELLALGMPTEKLERILHERVHQSAKRARRLANAVRSLAKYPPAFGLAGTVLGLMQLMKGISEGMNARETGIEMAVALIATFYGLMVANLFINPAGEALLKRAVAEEEAADLAVQAILLASENSNLLEAQEILNSFVPEEFKIDMLAGYDSGPSDEAVA